MSILVTAQLPVSPKRCQKCTFTFDTNIYLLSGSVLRMPTLMRRRTPVMHWEKLPSTRGTHFFHIKKTSSIFHLCKRPVITTTYSDNQIAKKHYHNFSCSITSHSILYVISSFVVWFLSTALHFRNSWSPVSRKFMR